MAKKKLRNERLKDSDLAIHPLEKFRKDVEETNSFFFSDIPNMGTTKCFYKGICFISEIVENKDLSPTNKMACFLALGDYTGFAKGLLSSNLYNQIGKDIRLGDVVLVQGDFVSEVGVNFIQISAMETYPKNFIADNTVMGRAELERQYNEGATDFRNAIGAGELIAGGDKTLAWIESINQRVMDITGVTEEGTLARVDSKVKNYLNASETQSFFWILLTAAHSTNYLGEAARYGNITRDEYDALKTATDALKAYSAKVLDRIDEKTTDRLKKRASSSAIRVFDEHTLNKFAASSSKVSQSVLIDRDSFEEYCEMLMWQNCKNCHLHQSKCELNTLFYENLIPESSWNLHNCPYAYEDNNVPENLNEYVRRLREIRSEKLSLATSIKNPDVASEFMSDMKALNKGIEAILVMKNGDVSFNDK